jgi:hypothetical protein
MHQYYKDILDRISEAPAWFDDYGVPRFGAFSPQQLSNVYAKEAALAEVYCQHCGRMFKVALTDHFTSKRFGLSDEIRLGRVHYGDPPNVHCCAAGPTMNSVMRRIIEYWSRDYEVSSDWQRDPAFEGPVGETRLDPPDTVAKVLTAVRTGVKSILVMCTSRKNRYDLAGRIAAALANDGSVLVACPFTYGVVAGKMLKGLVPDEDVGHWNDLRNLTVALFPQLKDVRPAAFDSVVVLQGPRPRNEAEQNVWNDVANRLATEAGDKVQIEFALTHSCCMIANPNLVVDAGRDTGGLS